MHAKKFASAALALGLAVSAIAAPPVADRATPKEAEAMVRKAIVYMKANPRDKAMADISNKKGAFVDRDLYLSIVQFDGTNIAHGANEKFIGKNVLDMRDIDGKEYMKERVVLAKTKTAFWHEFKFVDPLTKKIEPKAVYCEVADSLIVCAGVYKPA